MSKDKVLIVGAGAMGLTVGYHLHLARAEVSFLVRPQRAADLSRPQILYSYDDGGIRSFSEFSVLTTPEPVQALQPDYIVVTLDGAAAHSIDGTALLRALGTGLSASDTVMIGGGVGLGIREHYLQATKLPPRRLLMGTLGSLAHQVGRAKLRVHQPTDAALLAQADVAYRHYSKSGFILENRFPDVAKRFAALFDANGVSRCIAIEPHFYDIFASVPFPVFAGSELLGWPAIAELPQHKEIWQLTTSAVRETARLDGNGWRGKLAGLLLTDRAIATMFASIEKRSRPLDFQAFNAFHHGQKVAIQDRETMQNCVIAGEAEGKPMTSLKELLRRCRFEKRSFVVSTNRP